MEVFLMDFYHRHCFKYVSAVARPKPQAKSTSKTKGLTNMCLCVRSYGLGV